MPLDSNTVPSYRTLAQLRTALIARLGFADPLGSPTIRTLSAIRTSMLYLLGYGAQVANPPPGVAGTLNEFINEAQQSLFRRLELDKGTTAAPTRMAADGDNCTLDYQPVQTLAMAMYCAHTAKPEAKAYFEQHEKYVSDVAARRPPGLVATINRFLDEAQSTLVRRYPALHAQRWFSWPLTAGTRFYELANNAEQTDPAPCTLKLDPLRITEAWIERDTTRQRLRQGVPSADVMRTSSGWPRFFEVRGAIEVWPAPAQTYGYLRIKGRSIPTPLAADGDVPAVDDHGLYLLALANLKAHYKQPDARDIVSEFEVYLQSLVAGTHGGARYVPGRSRDVIYTPPVPTTPFP